MKPARLLMAAAAALTLAATGCGSSGSGSASGSGGAIKLGAWLPLSGPYASVGIPQRAGVDAYIKAVNAAGGVNGKQIDWIPMDNVFDPQQTIQVAHTLIQSDHVVAFLGNTGTAASQAAFTYTLDQAKVPIVFTNGGLANWYSPVQPLLFGAQTLYENQASALGQWVAQDGHKNVVLVRDDPDAYKTAAAPFEPAFKAADASATFQQVVVKSGTTDYTPIVSQVKALHPDAVVLIVPYTEAASYLKAAQLQGLTAQTYGYAPATDPGMITLAGSAANGFKGLSLTQALTAQTAALAEYKADMAKYEPGVPLTYYSLNTFAYAKAFIQVLKSIKGDITSASIAAAMERAGTITTGLLPPLTFSATKHLGTDEVQRMQVVGGQLVGIGGFFAPNTAI